MKKVIIIITAIVISSFLVISPLSTVDEKIENPEPVYTVRSYGDIIGVFLFGDNTPIKLVDIRISDLTTADRDLLDNGISVFSKKDLIELLENFD